MKKYEIDHRRSFAGSPLRNWGLVVVIKKDIREG